MTIYVLNSFQFVNNYYIKIYPDEMLRCKGTQILPYNGVMGFLNGLKKMKKNEKLISKLCNTEEKLHSSLCRWLVVEINPELYGGQKKYNFLAIEIFRIIKSVRNKCTTRYRCFGVNK